MRYTTYGFMNKPILQVLLLFITVAASGQCINLVPDSPATAANYWCTWYAQNYWQQRGGEISDFSKINNPNAREELTYHHLYNKEDGWVTQYLPRGRSDWLFLIDHGWQTQKEEERIPGSGTFFSLQLDTRDFPEYSCRSPQEGLRLFNEEIRSHGWRGLGIWVRGNVTPENAVKFVQWSQYAGIGYWKIDGGDIVDFNAYQAKKKYYPELVLEYVTGAGGNLNPGWDTPDQEAYPSVYDIGGAKQEEMLRVLKYTDAFRTYDASPVLMTVTTLRRTHDILKQTHGHPEYTGILNVQDDCNAAAALGCLVASKRHPNYGERLYKGKDLHHQLAGKRHMQARMNEPERFGRWQRIAPAFPAGEGSYVYSEVELVDYYPFTEHDTWAKATYGKTVYQSAPAIMARNMPLPGVEIEGHPPYVMATTYPNGPVCVATEGRVRPEDQWFHPHAKVSIQVKDAIQPIGVFGHYKELVVEFGEDILSVERVWAQDLLAEQARDIKSDVIIEERKLIIPGELIDKIGTSAGDEGDISVPGMVIKLEF
jgi:hypothetical protein